VQGEQTTKEHEGDEDNVREDDDIGKNSHASRTAAGRRCLNRSQTASRRHGIITHT
jgi:hypothetical protein